MIIYISYEFFYEQAYFYTTASDFKYTLRNFLIFINYNEIAHLPIVNQENNFPITLLVVRNEYL